jgi:hypothetical protein
LFFLLLDYFHERKQGNTEKSVRELKEWLKYALVYVAMGIGTFFWGWV